MTNFEQIFIATNNGDVGGGEIMLFNIARALRSLGHTVTIVGPSQPGGVKEAAADESFDVVILPAYNRKQYMAQLRIWDKRFREGLLWCNGLVPSFATAGHKNRIVHLHQVPEGKLRWLVKPAQHNAMKTLIPSAFGARSVAGSEAFPNWVEERPMRFSRGKLASQVRIGFLGRPSLIKGTDVLARAVHQLNFENKSEFKLLVAGTPDFIDETEDKIVSRLLNELGTKCEILGKTAPDEFFKRVDMVVVPSVWNEVFGLVATEAMSARVPLLVSDAGALPEVVGQDYPWIFERNNVDSLVQKILEVASLLANDPEKAEEIVNAAYWRWQENFSPEAGKARLQQLLSTLV